MKLLHIITSLRTGGAEKLMIDLIHRLKEAGHDVDLLLFDGIDTHFRREAENLGIKSFDLGVGGSVYSPTKFFKLLPYLSKYDIVHTHNTAPQLFAAIGSIGRNITLFTTEHNTTNRRRDKKYLKLFDKWMYNRYKKIICISQKAEDNLNEYLGKSKADIITINNGIDISRFANATPSLELETIAPGTRKIIMVAGFRDQKDQPTLIRSLKELPEVFHVFLVGDGERRSEFEELVKSLNLYERVHFLGIREDIPELLKASDYIALSSHYEGLSLSSVEGMAAGKPFLASNVDGLKEVVKDAGILFPEGDSKALAEEIKKLDSDRSFYEEISHKCFEHSKQFDISKMIEGYLEVYSKLL